MATKFIGLFLAVQKFSINLKSHTERREKHLEDIKFYDENQVKHKIAWGLCEGLIYV